MGQNFFKGGSFKVKITQKGEQDTCYDNTCKIDIHQKIFETFCSPVKIVQDFIQGNRDKYCIPEIYQLAPAQENDTSCNPKNPFEQRNHHIPVMVWRNLHKGFVRLINAFCNIVTFTNE